MNSLEEARKEIDSINKQIAELFKRRMQASVQVANYKKENGLPPLDKAREQAILDEMETLVGEDLAVYTRALFTSLFNISKAYQTSLLATETTLTAQINTAKEKVYATFPAAATVACQGAEGAYSQIAASGLFEKPTIHYVNRFEQVFEAVQNGVCKYGILPIENSSYGSVNEVYDLLHKYHFYIVRSMKLPIHHHLLAKKGTTFENIKEIFSHQQALGQCSTFLSALADDVKITACENTAIAAKMVAESGREDVAAISSVNCAGLYHLTTLRNDIQNAETNYTRFICVAKEMEIYEGANRISLLLTVPHEPGTLYNVISKFATLGLNLTKLESRPIAGKDFEFLFYFDLEASVWNEQLMALFAELSNTKELFVFLGSYSEV